MVCRPIKIGNVTAIVCGPRSRRKRCGCGQPADLLCDWKVGRGTCDKPICTTHAEEVAENKHLCPAHQVSYNEWLDARRTKADG